MGDVVEQGLGYFGDKEDRKAADRASNTQIAYLRESMAGQERAREEFRELLQPFVDAGYEGAEGLMRHAESGEEARPILQEFAQAGSDALGGQRALAGLDGAEAQASAIEGLRGTPEYDMLVGQAEEALLQNASATGGVRGGNTTSALMETRPGILTDLINRQYGRLGGLANAGGNAAQNLMSGSQQAFGNLASMGQNSAAMTGNTGVQTAMNVSNLNQQIGASRAGVDLMPTGWGSFVNNQRAGYARDQAFVQGLIGTAVEGYTSGGL